MLKHRYGIWENGFDADHVNFWSHAAFYVGDRLKTSDQEHMLIEAEAGIRDC